MRQSGDGYDLRWFAPRSPPRMRSGLRESICKPNQFGFTPKFDHLVVFESGEEVRSLSPDSKLMLTAEDGIPVLQVKPDTMLPSRVDLGTVRRALEIILVIHPLPTFLLRGSDLRTWRCSWTDSPDG